MMPGGGRLVQQSFASVQSSEDLKVAVYNTGFMNVLHLSYTVLQDMKYTGKSQFLFCAEVKAVLSFSYLFLILNLMQKPLVWVYFILFFLAALPLSPPSPMPTVLISLLVFFLNFHNPYLFPVHLSRRFRTAQVRFSGVIC